MNRGTGHRAADFGAGAGNHRRRLLRSIILFPSKLPKLKQVERLRNICEVSGIIFVLALIAVMAVENMAAMVASMITGIVFTGTFILIGLRMYQDSLTEHGLMR